MKKAKWLTLVAGALVTVVAVAVVAGCGSSSSSSSSSPSAAASMTPTQAFTKILGHAPTGMAATIATKGSFVVVDDANYPPQSYIDKNGNLIGFDVDVAKRLSTILGVPAKIVNAPWASVLSGIPVGRFDVSIGSMTITSDRAKSMAFSVPYYYTQAQVIVKQGSPILANAAALKGKTIGVGTGTTYAQYLDKLKGVKVKAYDTDASTFPDLRNGRLNGVMTADLTAAQAISSGYPFVFSGKPVLLRAAGVLDRERPGGLAGAAQLRRQQDAPGRLPHCHGEEVVPRLRPDADAAHRHAELRAGSGRRAVRP